MPVLLVLIDARDSREDNKFNQIMVSSDLLLFEEYFLERLPENREQ